MKPLPGDKINTSSLGQVIYLYPSDRPNQHMVVWRDAVTTTHETYLNGVVERYGIRLGDMVMADRNLMVVSGFRDDGRIICKCNGWDMAFSPYQIKKTIGEGDTVKVRLQISQVDGLKVAGTVLEILRD